MKKTIFLFVFLISTFTINLFLFNFNTEYRIFIENFKKNNSEKIITDEQVVPSKNPDNIILIDKLEDDNTSSSDWSLNNNINKISEETSDDIENNSEEINTENELNNLIEIELEKENQFLEEQNFENVLTFFSEYSFIQNDYFELFDFELSDNNFNIKSYIWDLWEFYFFKEWNFDEILSYLKYNKDNFYNPFEINENNLFWVQSFFINKIQSDWKVRIVISTEEVVFWIMLNKEKYNYIKNILLKL